MFRYKRITGIWSNGITGVFFINWTVTGESYLEMAKETVLPELQSSTI